MAVEQKETKPAESRAESWARYYGRHRARYFDLASTIDFKDFLSSGEQERLAEQETLSEAAREAMEGYEPLDESFVRIIGIQHGVAAPRLDRVIRESIAALNEKVSALQGQVDELTEMVRETLRTYNAMIYELGNDQYQLTMPIQIVLEEDQEETVARIPELNLYASADTDSEAISELKQEVIRLYEDLESFGGKLGPLPESWLQTLRKLIVKKNG